MNNINFIISVNENISDEKYYNITKGFKNYFFKKGFLVESVNKYSGSTEIQFSLSVLNDPVVQALLIAIGGIGIFVIKQFFGEIIKDFYGKLKNKNNDSKSSKDESEFNNIIREQLNNKNNIIRYKYDDAIKKDLNKPFKLLEESDVTPKKFRVLVDLPKNYVDLIMIHNPDEGILEINLNAKLDIGK